MTAICGMISWTAILYTSLRWHKGLKVQGIDRNTLPYRAPFQPYLSYCECESYHPSETILTISDGLMVAIFVMIFGGFSTFSKSSVSPRPRNHRLQVRPRSPPLQLLRLHHHLLPYSFLCSPVHRLQICEEEQNGQLQRHGFRHRDFC
jgi:hypothetical protein